MAYSPLPTSQIGSGKPTQQPLFQNIKDNFDDHETRVGLLEAGNFTVGANVSVVAITSTSFSDFTGLSSTITTHGRPVLILLEARDVNTGGDLLLQNTNAAQLTAKAFIRLRRSGSDVAIWQIQRDIEANAVFDTVIAPSVIAHLEHPVAGTYTYQLAGRCNAANMSISVENVRLLAQEL